MIAKDRTCDELGVCQARAECHVDCACPPQSRYPFAPGVIEGPAPKDASGDFVAEAIVALACVVAVAAVVGLVTGYLNLSWVLP